MVCQHVVNPPAVPNRRECVGSQRPLPVLVLQPGDRIGFELDLFDEHVETLESDNVIEWTKP